MKRALMLLLVLCSPLAMAGESYSFAAFGDTPFTEAEPGLLPQLMRQMHEAGAAFAVHVGNLKQDDSRCDDPEFAKHRKLLDAAPLSVVFVPGESDWLGCARHSAGEFKAEERLNKLRSLFFTSGDALGLPGLPVARQSEVNFTFGAFREHQRWQRGPVLFLTLNMPGGDNNMGRRLVPRQEFRHRLAAARDWIESTFALARENSLRGIVLFMHANPDFEAFAEGSPAPAYDEFLTALRDEVARFTGEVLFVHGETHVMRADRPLNSAEGEPLQRFRRLEVFGAPITGWVEITVDPAAPRLFRIRSKPLHVARSESTHERTFPSD